jgi:hypothetical protein
MGPTAVSILVVACFAVLMVLTVLSIMHSYESAGQPSLRMAFTCTGVLATWTAIIVFFLP